MFWLTEQKDTILPSLRSLDPSSEGEVGAKKVLHLLLSEPGNVSTLTPSICDLCWMEELMVGTDPIEREG
jgi:hypothetical protein